MMAIKMILIAVPGNIADYIVSRCIAPRFSGKEKSNKPIDNETGM